MKKKPSVKSLLWLKDELPVWQQENIITAEQVDTIWQRYSGLVRDKGISGRFVTVFLVIGALILGAGILLLIASNWRHIPGWVKLVFMFCFIAGANITGYELGYHRKTSPRLGEALLLLGSILFGAGIWLTAQVFHINAHYTDGVLIWFTGIIPFAWFLRSTPILVFSSIVLTGWALWENIGFQNPVLPYFFIMIALIFPLTYIKKSRLSLFISITGLLLWTGFGLFGEYFRSEPDDFIIRCFWVYFPLGIFTYCLGIIHSFHEKTKVFESIFKFSGIIMLFILLYIFSFKGMGEWIQDYFQGIAIHLPFWIFFGAAIILIIASLLFLIFFKKITSLDSVITAGELGVFLCINFFPFLILNDFFVISANIFLFGLSIGLVFIGYQDKKKLLVNTGFIFFGISFMTRYIDLGWMYSDRAFFFIIAGILIIGGGIALERFRRGFIKRMYAKKGDGEV
ncbi:MAG: DUF2157 domain-containing protein [Spirochaetales bacterium]|nr:DUF2157 domain-containing protein [Spirochaetales bacterium]